MKFPLGLKAAYVARPAAMFKGVNLSPLALGRAPPQPAGIVYEKARANALRFAGAEWVDGLLKDH